MWWANDTACFTRVLSAPEKRCFRTDGISLSAYVHAYVCNAKTDVEYTAVYTRARMCARSGPLERKYTPRSRHGRKSTDGIEKRARMIRPVQTVFVFLSLGMSDD